MSTDAGANLCHLFAQRLEADAKTRPDLGPFLAALGASAPLAHTSKSDAQPAAVEAHLATALKGLGCAQALSDAIKSVAAGADWYAILGGGDVDPALARGLVVGRVPFAPEAPARLGLFLLEPGLYYPPHQHAAQEIYFVASGTLSIQHGRHGVAFDIGPDQYSITPSNRVHALRTGADPVLMVYCWAGDIDSPTWWWEEDAGAWARIRWDRDADGRWHRTAREALTADTLREASE